MLIDVINMIYVKQKCSIYLDYSINNVVHYRVCAMANILKILLQNRNNVTFVTLLLHSWLTVTFTFHLWSQIHRLFRPWYIFKS